MCCLGCHTMPLVPCHSTQIPLNMQSPHIEIALRSKRNNCLFRNCSCFLGHKGWRQFSLDCNSTCCLYCRTMPLALRRSKRNPWNKQSPRIEIVRCWKQSNCPTSYYMSYLARKGSPPSFQDCSSMYSLDCRTKLRAPHRNKETPWNT